MTLYCEELQYKNPSEIIVISRAWQKENPDEFMGEYSNAIVVAAEYLQMREKEDKPMGHYGFISKLEHFFFIRGHFYIVFTTDQFRNNVGCNKASFCVQVNDEFYVSDMDWHIHN